MKSSRRTKHAVKRRRAVKGPAHLAGQMLRLAFYHCRPDSFLRTSGLLFREA